MWFLRFCNCKSYQHQVFQCSQRSVVWSPQGLDHFISCPFGFFILNSGFHILGALVGSKSFVESFITKNFHEDLEMISSLLMVTNLQASFTMISFCYVQCMGYLLHIMFSSPSILQHYAKFDIYTITTLEKLLSSRSFGGFIGHLTRFQAIFFVSSNRFNLPFVVRTIALAFQGC